ncbi:hypothetical protein COT42_06775 [Candidatus Saganbacteria bacterium CG08_land_8_20_14_0_20_45_16]|uniref:Uncharacterized protein n=1 Tax=Candidatus Saganbacteria bacterium CG08_land_8_20_14_0_20_45_16 TaxID=2014293 RepID=A0A2H0XVC4_UNCSA|nr:MAG: hypothetical protein COT42_06775 [Candidatus Saganbacteria bacterium CG08_land_8_20_14_0_20_45_16]
MGDIYVGAKDVTALVSAHFNNTPGVSLDGDLASSRAEAQTYVRALTDLEGYLSRANPSQRDAIHDRFEGYRSLVNNRCDSQNRSTPYIDLLEGLYDELTQFIESPAFDRLPPANQRRIAGLQIEVFSRLTQVGAPRNVRSGERAGTATEAPAPGTDSPYQADPALMQRVNDVLRSQVLQFSDSCGYNMGDAAEDGAASQTFYAPVGPVSGGRPQPIDNRDVNTDFRFGTHEIPRLQAEYGAARGSAQPGPLSGFDADGLGDI